MGFNIPQINIPGIGSSSAKKKKKKGEGKAVTYEDKLIEYLTSPSQLIKHKDSIQIDKFHRIIAAINYPRLVEPGWLTRLIELNLDFDLSIHLEPYSIESTLSLLTNELKKQKTDIYALEYEGKIVPQSLIQKHKDTKALLEAIQAGTEKMFTLSLYMDAKSYDEKELRNVSNRIRDTMNAIMVTPKLASFQMYKGLKSVLPIMNDKLKCTREITSSAVSSCFPFAITSLEQHATGILLGFNMINSIPIILDPFELSNPNILVLGTSGGGKSYCIKLMLMREFMAGVEINIIDPQAEYTDLITAFSGKTIKIAPGSTTVINPLDILGQTYDEKKLSLLAFFRVLLGELTEGQRAILDDTIDATYEDFGIGQDPKTWMKRPPTLGEVYDRVMPLTKSDKDIIYKPAMSIVNRMKSYVSGPLKFLNQQTSIDLGNRMINFDIKDIPDIGKGPIMFLLLEHVYTQMKKSKTRKMVVIDEAWTVLSAGEEGEYILRLVKTCRKFNLSLVMITQDVEDVLNSRAGRAVMTNTATKLLLKQDPTVVASIAERFRINENERRFLKTAGMGNALLLAGNMRVPLYIQASPEEHKIITTRPDELIELIHEIKGPDVEREATSELNVTKMVQRKIELTNEQVDALKKVGFTEVRVKTLANMPELFVVRNETEEMDEHLVLQHLIYEEVRKYTDKVLIHHTRLADVSFETPAGGLIGVEVISAADRDLAIEDMQQKLSVLKRYSEYFFVVTNPKIKEETGFGEILERGEVHVKIEAYFHRA